MRDYKETVLKMLPCSKRNSYLIVLSTYVDPLPHVTLFRPKDYLMDTREAIAGLGLEQFSINRNLKKL